MTTRYGWSENQGPWLTAFPEYVKNEIRETLTNNGYILPCASFNIDQSNFEFTLYVVWYYTISSLLLYK